MASEAAAAGEASEAAAAGEASEAAATAGETVTAGKAAMASVTAATAGEAAMASVTAAAAAASETAMASEIFSEYNQNSVELHRPLRPGVNSTGLSSAQVLPSAANLSSMLRPGVNSTGSSSPLRPPFVSNLFSSYAIYPRDDFKITLIVDKEAHRVEFVLADHIFVDVLCHFLTLPMATVVKILGEKSPMGFLNLQKSVQHLNVKYFETIACKNMLLNPSNNSEKECSQLAINLNEGDAQMFYRCPNSICHFRTHKIYSSVSGTKCRCGRMMRPNTISPLKKGEDGVFVDEGRGVFVVTDGLQITKKDNDAVSALCDLAIKERGLVAIEVNVTKKKVVKILQRSMVSKNPLSEVFLSTKSLFPDYIRSIFRAQIPCRKTASQPEVVSQTASINGASTVDNFSIRLVIDGKTTEVVYAVTNESNERFVNFMASVLTYPLGTIIRLLSGNSPMPGLNSLFRSIQEDTGSLMKSEEIKNRLVNPMLPPFYGTNDNLFDLAEARAELIEYDAITRVQMINPKLPICSERKKGMYLNSAANYLITRQMEIRPRELNKATGVVTRFGVDYSFLQGQEVSVGKQEMLELLKALFFSPDPLGYVFCKQKGQSLEDSEDLK